MTYSTAREERGREMNTTVRGHDLKAMALFALVLLSALIFAVWPAMTTGDGGGDPARRATNAGGPSITHDPYIERHTEVVASYQ